MVEHLLSCTTHASLLFFTDSGKVYQVPAYEIPEGTRISKGKAIFNFLSLSQEERITSILAVGNDAGNKARERQELQYIVMVTKDGIIKKVEANSFENVRRSGLIAITLHGSDALRFAKLTSGKDELMLLTREGKAVRFPERDVRPMGRQAAGVKGMRFKKADELVGADVIVTSDKRQATGKLLVIMENGFGKHSHLKEYKKQRRGGSGIKTAKITPKTGKVVSGHIIGEEEEELIAISRKGQVIRTLLSAIPTLNRATQGVRVMRLDAGDTVASITTL